MYTVHYTLNEKFISPFISFLKENFNSEKHIFVIKGGYTLEEMPVTDFPNILYIKSKWDLYLNFIKIFKLFKNARKIVFHGLFDDNIILFISFYQKLLKKCYWLPWGGDLYAYLKEKKGFKDRFLENRKKIVIRNIGNIVTGTKGDYLLAVKWYEATGKFIRCFNYPSNTFTEE